MYKVYCYFLVDDPNTLYAYTINKKYKELFEMQRNIGNFNYGMKKMEEIEYSAFMTQHRGELLIEDYYTDKKDTFQMIVTTEESHSVSESCNYIVDFITTLKYSTKSGDVLSKVLSEKDLKLIFKITNIIMPEGKDTYLNINTFKVFNYLFKNTLY